jgi:hypothetical protein
MMQIQGSKILSQICRLMQVMISFVILDAFYQNYVQCCEHGEWKYMILGRNYILPIIMILTSVIVQIKIAREGKCSDIVPLMLMTFNTVMTLERDIVKSPNVLIFPRL